MYQVNKHLVDYVELFLGFANRHEFDLDQALAPLADPVQGGGGISTPPIGRTLGIGACFVLRELLRQGLVYGVHLEPYCYPPIQGVREVLEFLGLVFDADDTRASQSKEIHRFLVQHLGPERATFKGAFDIPFQVIRSSVDIQANILGTSIG